MIYKTRGVVLGLIKYGETSFIAHVFTEKFGRQTYMVKGGRTKKSRIQSNLFQPFYLLDMTVYHRDGKNIHMVKDVQISETLLHLTIDVHKQPLVLFLAEILMKVLKEEEGDVQLFSFLSEHISYLMQVDEVPKLYHLNFLLNLTRFLGFHPYDNWSKDDALFDLDNAVFIPKSQHHTHCLSADTSRLFHLLLQTRLCDIDSLSVSSGDSKRLLRSVLNFYALHSQGFTSLKSLSVFEELHDL